MTEPLRITYQLTCAPDEKPEDKALGIALEQTVELPAASVDPELRERIVGRIEALDDLGKHIYRARIAYPLAAIGNELTQLLNVLFGNISLKGGIQIIDVAWPDALLTSLGGPGHGIEGLRAVLEAPNRPVTCTALKPMGSTPEVLARHAYEFAAGGLDIIKDDHGLANQPDAPFAERLARCQEAVERANADTGHRALYFPNVTAGYGTFDQRLEAARAAGCRGVLINAWLTGLDAVRYARDRYGLIVMAHPTFTGSYFSADAGMRPDILLGDLFRVAGADASIYPNVGGRFGFSLETCEAINTALRRPLGTLRPAFPTPGGGIDAARAPEWIARYGTDTLLLIGGSLYAQGDLRAAAAALCRNVSGSPA